MTVQAGRRPGALHSTSPASPRRSLDAISDAAAALHCEHFRRGPRTVKSYLTDDLIVCILSGILTPAERTLIGAGEAEQVRWRRALHQVAFEETYARRMAAITGRPVSFYLGTVCTKTDVAIYIFATGPGQVDRMPDPAPGNRRGEAPC